MPTQNFEHKAVVNGGVEVMEGQVKIWNHSPRIGGELSLRANPYYLHYGRVTSSSVTGRTHSGFAGVGYGRGELVPLENQSLTNTAGARYQAELAKAQASLLITLTQWNQSVRMLIERAEKLDKALQKATSTSKARRKNFRVNSDDVGNSYLEVKFGWAPLVTDIYNAMEVMAKAAFPPVHIRGSAKEIVFMESQAAGSPRLRDRVSGIRRCTFASRVEVVNPNKYLASQLGLTDLGTTAFDWVPWSFVLSMFSNINAVIGQFSTDCGISISDVSTTYSLKVLRESEVLYGSPAAPTGRVTCNVNYRKKRRTVVNHPPIMLELRLPSDLLGVGATLTALLAQRARRVTALIKNPLLRGS